ncbi:hypothetical protein ILYODFUR_034130 [Ilyodon furcidens]|uniref:Uncharacterized protein n=1 Tax=Ilyodon furcidens TaxID=33524 RepID=A0ABV0ULC4_9TELE
MAREYYHEGQKHSGIEVQVPLELQGKERDRLDFLSPWQFEQFRPARFRSELRSVHFCLINKLHLNVL